MSTLKLMLFRVLLVLVLIAAIIGTAGSVSVVSAYENNDEATCWISASPSSIYEGGSTVLTWGSHNAESGWISEIGDVGVNGSRTIYDLEENTTFTFTVENDEGTNSCSTKVYVRSINTPSYGTPGCTIYRENAAWGNGVTLRWYSNNASSAYISHIGAVSTYGSYVVYPTYDTNYILTVYGNGKTSQCEIEIDRDYSYNSSYYPNQYYTPGYSYNYPYVALTQIPYTGFDLGVVGTSVYFLVLALFALSGAYLLAYYQGGILRFSFASEVKCAMRNQVRAIRNIFSN